LAATVAAASLSSSASRW